MLEGDEGDGPDMPRGGAGFMESLDAAEECWADAEEDEGVVPPHYRSLGGATEEMAIPPPLARQLAVSIAA